MSALHPVPGLERGIAILRMFGHSRTTITAPEVAAELDLPRSTVHRLLGCLTDLNMLRRSLRSVYSLGPGVLSIGFEYLAAQDIVSLAQPVLERLRDQTDCSTHLAVRDGRSVIYLARVPGRSAVAGNVGVGSSLPAHATLMGRLMLADLEPLELRALYNGQTLSAAGPETPVTMTALRAMLDADRARGFAVSKGFFERGVGGVAAPIRDSNGRITAAINAVKVVTEDAAPTDLDKLAARVVAAAQEISSFLGSRPTAPAQSLETV